MEKFVNLDAPSIPMGQDNIDTDQIIPARFLQKSRKAGLQSFLFHDLRFDDRMMARPDFVFNDRRYEGARILVAGRNFGCGSSREAAVYALWDCGIRAIVAPSFGDIFLNNCFMNGLLPITLSHEEIEVLSGAIITKPGTHIRIELEQQEISLATGFTKRFVIDEFNKHCLLSGVDELDFTKTLDEHIAAFEKQLDIQQPWLRSAALSQA